MKHTHVLIWLTLCGFMNSLAIGAEDLPKLIDLGAKKCIPCKKMAPILEALKTDYADTFTTEFIDVWQKENAAKAKAYNIEMIPTQIFFDATGKELWRHQGFLSREAILDKWTELGVKVKRPAKPKKNTAEKP